MPQIIIDITVDGATTIDANGFQGRKCKDATKAIERALGKTTEDTKKPEFFHSSNTVSKKVSQR